MSVIVIKILINLISICVNTQQNNYCLHNSVSFVANRCHTRVWGKQSDIGRLLLFIYLLLVFVLIIKLIVI